MAEAHHCGGFPHDLYVIDVRVLVIVIYIVDACNVSHIKSYVDFINYYNDWF